MTSTAPWRALRAAALALAAVAAPSAALASSCFGVSQGPPAPPYLWGGLAPTSTPVLKAHVPPGALTRDQVGVSFVRHASLRIDTAAGVSIVTDYAGFAGLGPVPTVVTMNNAHETHFTNRPNPAIKHVLRGWGTGGAPAAHDLRVEDVRIRNVPTDLVYGSRRVPNGNSIFVFEVADLCIGHLGHLHHMPTDAQFAAIGFLDIVFAPVDGVFTMTQAEMIAVLKRLRARVVIPMHYFGPSTLKSFVDGMRGEFAVAAGDGFRSTWSRASLPARPTVFLLPPFRVERDR